MISEFRAMGTDWWVQAPGADERTMRGVRSVVETEEQRFSRFREHSTLSRLNRTGAVTDRRLAEVARLARSIGRATGGAFDPCVGRTLIAAGYDRSFELLAAGAHARRVDAQPGAARLRCARHHVRLQDGALDLGGIAKGWTVDRVGEYLRARSHDRYIIDAGGDILVAARGGDGQRIGLQESAWAVRLHEGAVATSSTLRRRWQTPWGPQHHIVDPAAGAPAQGPFVTASVVAPTAAVADALGTALLADAGRTMPALARFRAEAFLVDESGAALITPGMERWLA